MQTEPKFCLSIGQILAEMLCVDTFVIQKQKNSRAMDLGACKI